MSESNKRASRDVDTEHKIYFHPKQIECIESIFPERYISSDATEAELREYMGTRKVVHFIKSRMNSNC